MCRSYASTLVSPQSFPILRAEDTTIQKSKRSKKEKKQVQFSDMSSMVFYEDATPKTNLHYSASDYSRFKNDAHKSARNVRQAIKESLASNMQNSKSTIKQAPLKCYTKSWTILPDLLKENEIDTTKILGIEHLVLGKDIAKISLKLRYHCAKLIFDEQRDQDQRWYTCPETLLAIL